MPTLPANPAGVVRQESATEGGHGIAISSATGLSPAPHGVQLRRGVGRSSRAVGTGGGGGGGTLLAWERARSNADRGFFPSCRQWGGRGGLSPANVMVLLFSWISGDQFLDWGWRVPFWLSIVMVG